VKPRALLRALARFGVVGITCTVVALIAVQYARIVQKNVTYARELGEVRRDVDALEQKRVQQLREIGRLSDPQGSIPEIHDRLHLVGSHEAIIYVARPHE
jgi:hypothetical protein